MSASVLVTYATRYGSTEEVARVVAGILRKNGLNVDVQPVKKVRDLQQYDAVVLGAPLYIGHLHKDAQHFLEQYTQLFEGKKLRLVVFTLGPLHEDEEEFQGAQEQLEEELARYPQLAPIAVATFGGKYDPSRLNLPDRIIAKVPATPLHGQEATDIRDWTAIHTWAGDLAHLLGTGQPAS